MSSTNRNHLNFLKPLYHLGVLMGPFPWIHFETSQREHKNILHFCYPLLLCLIYLLAYCVSVWKRSIDSYPFTPNITDAILDAASYTCMTITSLALIINNCFLHDKDLQEFVTKFRRIDWSLRKFEKSSIDAEKKLTKSKESFDRKVNLKEKDDFEMQHRNWFYIHVIFLGLILIGTLLYMEFFWIVTITFASNWGYTAMNFSKIQLFVTSMMIYNWALALKHRFAFINRSLNAINLNIFIHKDVFVIGDNSSKSSDVEFLNRIHKQLLLMCVDFNKIFGTPILLLSATFIFSILHPINSAICQLMKGNVFDGVQIPNFGMHYVIMSVLSAFNTLVLVVPLAHASYGVMNESKTAIRYSENLSNQFEIFNYDNNLKSIHQELMQLARESSANYPIFTASCFYKVDHTMLFTLFGSVTTYLIVLIQINML